MLSEEVRAADTEQALPAPERAPLDAAVEQEDLRLLEHFTRRLGTIADHAPLYQVVSGGGFAPASYRLSLLALLADGERGGPADGAVGDFMRLPLDVDFGERPAAGERGRDRRHERRTCAARATAGTAAEHDNTREDRPDGTRTQNPDRTPAGRPLAARSDALVRRALVDETFRNELERRLGEVGLRLLDNPYAAHVAVALQADMAEPVFGAGREYAASNMGLTRDEVALLVVIWSLICPSATPGEPPGAGQ